MKVYEAVMNKNEVEAIPKTTQVAGRSPKGTRKTRQRLLIVLLLFLCTFSIARAIDAHADPITDQLFH
ncbi:MAG: hypothetical protein KDD70_08400, partial [Bdellovibrionales bacterium]|nr:hypothetical protein [Bdellovibrionales bacterium]